MKKILFAIVLFPLIGLAQSNRLAESQSKELIDKLAKLITNYDTRYDRFNYIPDCNFAIFSDTNNLQGIVDINGKVLLPKRYHIYRQNGTALFLVVGDTTMGLVDKNMRWVLPMEYDHNIDCLECIDMCNYFSRGFAVMPKGWLYGAVDTNGKVLVPFKYEAPFDVDLTNRLLYFFNEEEEFDVMTVTDFEGKRLIGPYPWIDRFSEGLAGFQKNDKYGFLDIKGNVVIPAKYDYTGWKFENGTALVNNDEKQMLIDKKGKVKHRFADDYEVQLPLWNNTIFIVKKYYDINFSLLGDYGVVDSKGKVLVPIQYQGCGVVNNKYFVMSRENLTCDVYDRNGTLKASFNQVVSADFVDNEDEISTSISDHYVVMKDSLWGIVDSNFNIVLPCRYIELTYLGHGFAMIVNEDQSASIIDLTGKVIVQGPYQDFTIVNEQLFKFYSYNPDNYDEMIVGYVDIYGNSTATAAQMKKMRSWIHNE